MSIIIDRQHCIGCGRCSSICPGTLIHLNAEHKAEIVYPRDCWGCASCLKECPAGAISFYLGPDIGGRGSTMKIEKAAPITKWIITKPDNTQTIIETDSRSANKY